MEHTIFFVKNRHLRFSQDILDYLVSNVTNTLIDSRGLVRIPEEGWMKFYKDVGKRLPLELAEMARDFSQHPIGLFILSGEHISNPVKNLVGPTRHEDNPSTTIRGKWGPYELPHTIVHASSPGDFEREGEILNEYLIGNV